MARDATGLVRFRPRGKRMISTDAGQGRQTEIREIERALALLAEGRYGICRSCGAPIRRGRLAIDPWTSLCDDCRARGSFPPPPTVKSA